MKITAITRYKQGELYAILKRLGWSQSELARKSSITEKAIGCIINLHRRPNHAQADAIQRALAEAGEYIDVLEVWPETFVGLKRGYKCEVTAEIEMDRLLDHPEIMQIAAPDEGDETLDDRLHSAIKTLPENAQTVLREVFWNGKSKADTGKGLNLSLTRVSQIETKAIRMLRHPKKMAEIQGLDYYPGSK